MLLIKLITFVMFSSRHFYKQVNAQLIGRNERYFQECKHHIVSYIFSTMRKIINAHKDSEMHFSIIVNKFTLILHFTIFKKNGIIRSRSKKCIRR